MSPRNRHTSLRTDTKTQADRFYIQLRDGGGSLEHARETLLDERVAIGVLLYVAHALAPHDFGGSMVRSSLLTLIDEWEGAYAARQALQRVAPVLSHARAVIDLYKDRPELEEQPSASPQSKADSASARIAELEAELTTLRSWRDSVVARSVAAGRKVPGEGLCDWFEMLAECVAKLEAELAARPMVEPEAARKLREELKGACLVLRDRELVVADVRSASALSYALRDFARSAPPTCAPVESERVRLLTEQLNAQAKSHAEEGERWSREMGELKCELEALKAAPARVEREVEAELRTAMAAHPTWALSDDVLRGNVADETMRLILAGRAWLAAPLSAAPAPSEERVTLYVVQAACSSGLYRCSADYQPRSNERVLALDARVVREGGA